MLIYDRTFDCSLLLSICLSYILPLSVPLSPLSCFLSSVVFSMFATLDTFDALLTRPLPVTDEGAPRRRLQILLATTVNILRSGDTVPLPVMNALRLAVYEAGFQSMAQVEAQQDASELFLFLLDQLAAPVFTFQQRMFHGGIGDNRDTQRLAERVLQVSIPAEGDEASYGGSSSSSSSSSRRQTLRLEFLLQDHFSNAISGLRRQVTAAQPIKEVDAWKVMSMLPVYSTANSDDTGRFVLPLIIKRYAYDAGRGPRRLDVSIAIPHEVLCRALYLGSYCSRTQWWID